MKVKLDENLGAMVAVFLKAAGFDVATIAEQNLLSRPDADLAKKCAAEERCHARQRFLGSAAIPPRQFAGIIVVRLPDRFRLPLLERALALVVEASKQSDVRGRLWIAEVDRIREYQERVE